MAHLCPAISDLRTSSSDPQRLRLSNLNLLRLLYGLA